MLEDIHWAQPGLLDLIEAVASNAAAAVMILCLARPELIDARPSFGASVTGALIELRPLPPEEVRRIVLDVAEPGSSARAVDAIVSVAAGNPLFALQLVAWAGESVSARSMPPAVRTLLASRIGGLGPGERAVVQCGAIAGRDFSLDAVTALLAADVRPTAGRHLAELARRQFVEPTGPGYRFRHHTIHRTAYASIDPHIRARLHEQHADWLTSYGTSDPGSTDETIGYHLEQAYNNLQTGGMREEHARLLCVRGGTHLAAAGRRALGRLDMPGAASLITRALRLLPDDDPQRLTLMVDACRPLRTSGRVQEAITTALEAIDQAQRADDVVIEWRARLEVAFLRAFLLGDRTGNEARRIAEKAVDVLGPLGDDYGLAYALVIIGMSREALGELSRAATAYQQALHHARRSPTTLTGGQIVWGLANILLEGPTPVPEALARCPELVEWRGHTIAGALLPLAQLHALNADFDEARAVLVRAARIFREWGMPRAPIYIALAESQVELAAGELENAERHARHGLEVGASVGGDECDGGNALVLARSLCQQGRFDEAEDVVAAHASATSGDDIGRIAMWNAVRAEIRAHRSAWKEAAELARRAVLDIDRTDLFNLRAELRLTLASVLGRCGDADGASRAATEALRLFETKGNLVGVANARAFLGHI